METALTKRIGRDPTKWRKFARFCIQKHQDYAAAMETAWRPMRAKYALIAQGDFSWRVTKDATSIFSRENKSLEFFTAISEFLIARTAEDIYGSDPFLAVIPVGRADQRLSRQMTLHSEHKLREAKFKQAGRDAIRKGFDLGEGIQKIAWKREVDTFDRLAMVMMDRRTKREVTTQDGEFVEATDFSIEVPDLGLLLWSKSPITPMPEGAQFVLLPDLSPVPILADAEGVPVLAETEDYFFESDVRLTIAGDPMPLDDGSEGQELAQEEQSQPGPVAAFLAKSEIISQEPDHYFEERLIEETRVRYDGLHVATVNHMDFVAPLNVADLEDADYVGMTMGLRLSFLAETYDLTKEKIRKLRGDTPDAKSAQNLPKTSLGETAAVRTEFDQNDPEIKCIESCVGYAFDDDLRPKRVFALIAVETEEVLFTDYRANVTKHGKLPYPVTVPFPVSGRWWGRSIYEIYEGQNDFLDRMFSALVYRNHMHANPMKVVRPGMLKESEAKKGFEVSPDKTFEVKPEFSDFKFMEFIEFPSFDELTWKIIELVMQMAQIRSGVTSAAQGSMTNLPGMQTATGTQSIMMSGSTLHKLPIENCKDGQELCALLAIQTLYAHHDIDETITITEGDADQLVTITAESVRGLEMNVRLLLTRLHEKEAMESARAAIDAIERYLATPEGEKEAIRPLYLQVLKSLRITGADSILRQPIPPDPNAAGVDPDNTITESINYAKAPPSIQRQMEARAGYQPATEEESAQQTAAEKKSKDGEQPPEERPAEPLPANAA